MENRVQRCDWLCCGLLFTDHAGRGLSLLPIERGFRFCRLDDLYWFAGCTSCTWWFYMIWGPVTWRFKLQDTYSSKAAWMILRWTWHLCFGSIEHQLSTTMLMARWSESSCILKKIEKESSWMFKQKYNIYLIYIYIYILIYKYTIIYIHTYIHIYIYIIYTQIHTICTYTIPAIPCFLMSLSIHVELYRWPHCSKSLRPKKRGQRWRSLASWPSSWTSFRRLGDWTGCRGGTVQGSQMVPK